MASPVQLPDDIVYYKILPRLPFRALMRLTAVCKVWRDTIYLEDAFATAQEQIPSRASVAIARFVEGGSLQLQILSPCSEDVVPPDPFLSFVEVEHSKLSFCACTGGLVCLKERPDPHDHTHWQRWLGRDRSQSRRYVRNFFVVNPNRKTHRIRHVPYDFEGEVVTAGLAYDPETAASEGFQLVVPVAEDGGRCRFRRFASRRAEWSVSREAFALPPVEEFKPKPVYVNRHVYWLAGDIIVWYDLDGDRAGTMPLQCNGGNLDIGAWRGRLRLAHVNTGGVLVCELAGGHGAGAKGWDIVHSRPWRDVPGMICPQSSWTRVSWKLGTMGMEAGGEEAVCVEVTMERERDGLPPSTWRGLLRYDVQTGTALSVLKLRDHHQKVGPLVDYHSSMAKLPDITWDPRRHPRIGRKSLWGGRSSISVSLTRNS